ncbi:MAG: hypothetical protein AAF614_24980 [Chloroflexota bacterium]
MKRLRSSHYRTIIALTILLSLTRSVMGEAPTASATAVPSSLAVLTPSSPVTFAEMDEFATTVLGDPWDMNEATDLSYYREDSNLVNSQFANGFYSAQMTAANGSERITLLTNGSRNNAALRIGKIGYNYPINADHYRYLTFRIFKGSSSCASGLVQWFADDSYSNASSGISNSIRVLCEAGWGTYVVDLRTIGIQSGGKQWGGIIRELILKPYAGAGSGGSTVKLDYARLTAQDPWTARPYDIQWTGDGSGGDVSLYASPNDKVLSGDEDILFARGESAFGGTFTFQTGLLPPGTYYIAATNGSGTAWSEAPIVIGAPPKVTITKPGASSGVDYATTEKGNAWDMNDASDINDSLPIGWHTCVVNESFTGGVYRAMDTTCSNLTDPYSDSKLILGHMNPSGSPDPVVDTNKYRYLSFRYRLAGTQNVQEGWVARFGWWQEAKGGLPGSSAVMSRDIILLEGWNTYHIDLWANDIVDESHPVQRSWRASAPNRLRFDPSEIHQSLAPAQIEIDWIKLTAMDEVTQGGVFPIEYELEAERPTTLTFFYDNDRNQHNGRSHIGTITRGATRTSSQFVQPQAEHMLFLPTITRGSVNCSNNCFAWETITVPRGEYYICTESNDGLNASYSCSDTPVAVR